MNIKPIIIKLILIIVVLAGSASAQSQDSKAYCAYLEAQARAEKAVLISPSTEVGIAQQPIVTNSPQLFQGLVSGISNIRKARAVEGVAKDNCKLYAATTDLDQRLQFALAGLQKQFSTNRLLLLDSAQHDLNSIIADVQKKVDAQDVTVTSLYVLQYAQMKFDLDRSGTQTQIAAIYTPDTSDEPGISTLLAKKQVLEIATQTATNDYAKKDDWDLQLNIGMHESVTTGVFYHPAAYGTFNLRYNLGSRQRDKNLDASTAVYSDWKTVQEGDAVRLADILRRQIVESIAATDKALQTLNASAAVIQGSLTRLAGVYTAEAEAFRNQLLADQLALRVETLDMEFRTLKLQAFLDANF